MCCKSSYLITRVFIALSLLTAAIPIPSFGLQRATRDSGQSADLVALTQTADESRLWKAVAAAPDAEKALRSNQFLLAHPQSKLAALAHYFIASSAFRDSNYKSFLKSSRVALTQFPSLVQQRPLQSLRWLSLLSLTGFYLAETGASEEPRALARKLLSHLEAPDSRPPNMNTLQWGLQSKKLGAAAHYVLGRVHLSLAAGNPDESSAQLLLARREFEATVIADPMDPYANFRLANVLEAQGQAQLSRAAFARAVLGGGPVSQLARQRLSRDETLTEESIDKLLSQQDIALSTSLTVSPRSVFLLSEGVPHPIYWWDYVPEDIQNASLQPPGVSNVRFDDYAGPESCKTCHEDKYGGWSGHSHRWMNTMATIATVKGDFSGTKSIRYKGGLGEFRKDGGEYRMVLSRGRIVREYSVRRTIGSRFFQYYVGRLAKGPEDNDHVTRGTDHVLPFGYWIEPGEWVPVVHINPETQDAEREDPFLTPSRVPYDRNCSPCHTTRPFADWMLTTDGRLRVAAFSPYALSFRAGDYLFESHRDLLGSATRASEVPTRQMRSLINQSMNELPAESKAVTLGVSCEACHNGAREHVDQSTARETRSKPLFFPSSELLLVQGESPTTVWGRTPANINWICARCHSGSRPRFAGGMDTWNSTEYSDASRGFCYSPEEATRVGKTHLTCVHCHDPHFTIGQSWNRSAAQDDARCQSCHDDLVSPTAVSTHTRHPLESEGARCMNCHMPRVNEGLQDVVRTHQISSPTNRAMIEANQPNACNLCHLDRPLEWTKEWLQSWYGETYEPQMQPSAPTGTGIAVGLGWLESAHESTRLVAAAALLQRQQWWAVPELLETLDDPFLINRQFAQRGLERMLGIDLREMGYRFYLESEERAPLLRKIKSEIDARFGARIRTSRREILPPPPQE